MANRVVIGSQWGDEGKAKIVDFLTLDADVIVRFQGGANAGHTVEVGDKKFVFHLIPSGIMHPTKVCVVGNGVVLDPIQTLNEIADLHNKGINPEGRLFIADNAHVVLPYHSALDRAKEKKAGKAAIGTTGRGIGPCYSDKVNRIGVRVGDLLDEKELRPRVEAMAKVHNEEFRMMFDAPEIDPEQVIKDYLALGQKIKPFVRDVSDFLFAQVKAGKRLIFEGAQGTILDVDHGTYPFVTSSNTVAGYAACGSGLGPTAIDQVVGVVKAYTTRVGNGPFPTELLDATGDKLRKIGNEYGATTGRNRRCGWFDAPVVRKAAVVNGLTHLAITKLDVLDTFDEIQICTHYECDGEKLDLIPNQLSKVSRCTPVYETMPGWNASTTACRSWDSLPENAKKYLMRMSELVGVKIGMISIGAKRDESIIIDMD
ncbi:MAG: adenylosuccinate synthase [Fibrobacteraceae bacterium]|nr:adenylosuccinate synthase [Fibrobacteraceae bacterium]